MARNAKVVAICGSILVLQTCILIPKLLASNDPATDTARKENLFHTFSQNASSLKVAPIFEEERDYGGVVPRPFPRWPQDVPLPCIPAEENWKELSVQKSKSKDGYLFVRLPKTASSTVSGVVLRIARNLARLQNIEPMCKVRVYHGDPLTRDYHIRDTNSSFLISFLREPTKRMTSQFFFREVSRGKKEPSDENFLNFIQNVKFVKNVYVGGLRLSRGKGAVSTANEILQKYNFIGITERLDESLVAMQMILGLKTEDILYLSAKSSGGYDEGAIHNKCYYIFPSFVSPGMKEYFSSSDWKDRSRNDYMMYHAVNKSLDLTIESLGQEKFLSNLARFKIALEKIRSTCVDVRYPCSPGGKKNNETDCQWEDAGCGYHCIDRLVDEMHL